MSQCECTHEARALQPIWRMPIRRKPSNPWESELLRLGRRFVRDAVRGAVETGTELAVGGLDTLESALTQAVAPVR